MVTKEPFGWMRCNFLNSASYPIFAHGKYLSSAQVLNEFSGWPFNRKIFKNEVRSMGVTTHNVNKNMT
jgi:hypothetical protein